MYFTYFIKEKKVFEKMTRNFFYGEKMGVQFRIEYGNLKKNMTQKNLKFYIWKKIGIWENFLKFTNFNSLGAKFKNFIIFVKKKKIKNPRNFRIWRQNFKFL